MAKIVALLDSMWGGNRYHLPGEEAPSYFEINPNNHSGRRLHSLIGEGHQLLVTNSCRMVQESANHHGKADVEWVRNNLIFLQSQGIDLLLVCGTVARRVFEVVTSMPELSNCHMGESYIQGSELEVFKFICMDHPAARRWSKEKIEQKRELIRRTLCPISV